MTRHKVELVIDVDSEDVLEADGILRDVLEGAETDPWSDLKGYRIGEVLRLD